MQWMAHNDVTAIPTLSKVWRILSNIKAPKR